MTVNMLAVIDVVFQMFKLAIVCCVVVTALAAPFTAELDTVWSQQASQQQSPLNNRKRHAFISPSTIRSTTYYIAFHFQMFKLAIVCCVVATVFAAPFTAELDSEWEAFKIAHNKQYDIDIEPLR